MRSNGMVVCEISYSRFWMSRWIGIIGKNGRNALANMTLNMLPKFELAVILMYLLIFPKVFRPSSTPSSSTIRSFSSRIISALSLAMSTAESTEMPISDCRKAAASLIPSPRNPTVFSCSCKMEIICVFCRGVNLEKQVVVFTRSFKVASSIFSISGPINE